MAAVEPLFVHRTRAPISSSPLLVDADRDTRPEIFVGGRALYGLDMEGTPLPRWPRRGGRPFASSPAFGDIDGDGRREIVAGCDDGRVYAFYSDGEPVPGWPVSTEGDVFSTPALVDLDGDGALEVVVGSDDGFLYALRGDGSLAWKREVPRRPFVSSSPGVVERNGTPTVVAGAWDGQVRSWSGEGVPSGLSAPQAASPIWASPLTFQTDEGTWYGVWAAERLFVHPWGTGEGGWTARTRSWMASSPALALFRSDRGALVVGSDRLYAWDLAGRPLPGWPVEVRDYVWASPIVFDLDGDGEREVVAGSWDGGVYAVHRDGTLVPGFPLETGGPIFSTPAAAPLPEGGGVLVAASWDGTIRGWHLPRARFEDGDWTQFRGGPTRTGRFRPEVGRSEDGPEGASIPGTPGRPRIRDAWGEVWYGGVPCVRVRGDALDGARRLLLHYVIPGEQKPHPSPVVRSQRGFMALVQPLWWPARVRFWLELEREDGATQRWPPTGAKPLVGIISALSMGWRRTARRVGLRPPSRPHRERGRHGL